MEDLITIVLLLLSEQLTIAQEDFEKYKLISTGKKPFENISYALLPQLSAKAKEYGFEYKLINMICSLDSTNESIILINKLWELIRSQNGLVLICNTYFYNKYCRLCAYVIHDMRHFVDQMIVIVWVLSQSNRIEKIKVDCIGKYLEQNKFTVFENYKLFMQKLNDISNAYKHSASNDLQMFIGRDEPCLFALDANHNRNFLHPKLDGITINNLVNEFNSFYHYCLSLIASL